VTRETDNSYYLSSFFCFLEGPPDKLAEASYKLRLKSDFLD